MADRTGGLTVVSSVAGALLAIGGIALAMGGGAEAASEKPGTSPSQTVEEQAAASVVVPELTGRTVERARTQLKVLGLELAAPDGVGNDWVITGQTTAAGEKVDSGATVTVAAERPKPTLTLGHEQAVAKARDYLSVMAFSRSGLIDQLELNDFSTEDATFAVDYIAPDWNAQAALKAQSHLDVKPFSRQGLIDQLVFDGFSQAEAEFGVAQAGL
ncbi:Ltp family lipoprotein [Microbacterium sp. B2969]|uniref:Ltp family lipoprotein n=1 Tax=Microbacterium alkaliflavum TaxID=3248839 RepID=A0ABW7Q3Z0_9MICO